MQHLKSKYSNGFIIIGGFREAASSSKGEESIYALGSNNINGEGNIKLSGLGIVKQQTAQV
ncbi:MAG: hypothetical protein ACMG6E_09090 [Candidatus Roizmanbacteria bacterium]